MARPRGAAGAAGASLRLDTERGRSIRTSPLRRDVPAARAVRRRDYLSHRGRWPRSRSSGAGGRDCERRVFCSGVAGSMRTTTPGAASARDASSNTRSPPSVLRTRGSRRLVLSRRRRSRPLTRSPRWIRPTGSGPALRPRCLATTIERSTPPAALRDRRAGTSPPTSLGGRVLEPRPPHPITRPAAGPPRSPPPRCSERASSRGTSPARRRSSCGSASARSACPSTHRS
jgi:hypothetical protein